MEAIIAVYLIVGLVFSLYATAVIADRDWFDTDMFALGVTLVSVTLAWPAFVVAAVWMMIFDDDEVEENC